MFMFTYSEKMVEVEKGSGFIKMIRLRDAFCRKEKPSELLKT
jgi:hypothetical protein